MILEVNVYLFRLINDIGKEYTFLNPMFIFIAKYMVFFLGLSTVIFFFSKNKVYKQMAISGAFAFVFAEIFGKLAGKMHSNLQPFSELSNVNQLILKEVDNSFPSDHTILFFSFCVTFWLYKKKGSFVWILLALLVGFSRIWVGVHYPADILVGALIATICAYVMFKVIPKISFINRLVGLKNEQTSVPSKEHVNFNK